MGIIINDEPGLDLIRQRYAKQRNEWLPADAVICGRDLFERVKFELSQYPIPHGASTCGPVMKLMGMEFYVSDDLELNEVIIGQRR